MSSKKPVAKMNFFKRMRLRLIGSSTNHQENVVLETIGDSKVVESTSDYIGSKDKSSSVKFHLANENQNMTVLVGPIVADQVENAIGDSKVDIESISNYVSLKAESSSIQRSSGQKEFDLVKDPKFGQDEVEKGSRQVQFAHGNQDKSIPVDPAVFSSAENMSSKKAVAKKNFFKRMRLRLFGSSTNRQENVDQETIDSSKDVIESTSDNVGLKDKTSSVQVQLANENQDMTIPVDPAVFSSAENMSSKKTVKKKNFFKRMRLRLFGSSNNRQENVDLENIGDSKVVIESTSNYGGLKDEPSSVQVQLSNENQDLMVPVGLTVADQAEIAIGDSKVIIESISDYVGLKDEPSSIQSSSSQTKFDLVKDPKFDQDEIKEGSVQVQFENENQNMTIPEGPAVADQVKIAIGYSKVDIESTSDHVGLKDESSLTQNSSNQTELNLVNDPKFDQDEFEKGSAQVQLANEN